MIFAQWARRAPGLSPPRVTFLWDLPGLMLLWLARLFYRFRSSGRERVPRRGAIVFVANHQSHFDPVLVGIACMDRPSAYLARASLFTFKPFGWLIRLFHAIPIDRQRGSADAMRGAIAVLQAGRCLTMFPEGTRTRDGALGTFRPGMVLVARRGGAAIVPVAIDGAHDVWPHSRRLPRWRGAVSVRFGTPVTPQEVADSDQDALVERLRLEIDAMRLELRRATRERTGGRLPPAGPADEPSASVSRTSPP